ncbi:hemolysin family protein [Paenibacillus endoradicis]|uniref:hemolysin family protein n=1 Tax=Paenibacillus endoradicis TaxID=2972487 RepID=UPI002159786E|nr:hemolysin family protein [Paenibacillus endoradicis]MCR8655760.1 hemolysin family protein [Paenibacillus endoradicis]MCR8658086.1 hemolysin family protein [Paenibacillus endoradicis]
MSILFIVYSSCLFINNTWITEWKEKKKNEDIAEGVFSRFIPVFSFWSVKYLPIFCLIWLGMLLLQLQLLIVRELEATGTLLQRSSALWIGTIVGSVFVVLLLYMLHRKWIPKRKLNVEDSASIVTFIDANFEENANIANVSNMEGNSKYDFGEKTAREVMTPRLDMICLEWNKSLSVNIETAITHMRTRYPVVNHDKDDIIGFVHIKDLLAKYDHKTTESQWQQWIRPIITVSDTIAISTLLAMMQKKKTQIALLIDEYGGTSGMATLEDILEEIVGDIQDEFDEDEHDIVKLQPDHYMLSAMLLVEEVNSYFNIGLEVDDMDSIGGYMYANIQFPPHIGQSVAYKKEEEKYIFTIEQMDQLRITSISVKRIQATTNCDQRLR